jgi:DMSO/TMAO reductase YedYZ molybdopterin-dependent catalytic subunit
VSDSHDPLPLQWQPLTRRELVGAGLAAAGALLARRLGAQQDPAPGTGGLVLRNARALDAEAPLSALASYVTAPEHFFVRSHFGPPARLPRPWTLTIDGSVRRPLTLSIDELRAMGAETRTVTLECAGNGRGAFGLPKTSGLQWQRGAVSNATWTGVPLGAVLERAGLGADAAHLWMEALDRAALGTVPKFMRSIPREVGLGDALIAYGMNGGAIPLLHGGPLRLIVPGWYGMTSTKWLTHIHARPQESDNHFMVRSYRYADGTPVRTMLVKSVIATPGDGQRVRAGRLTVRGQAWSGAGSGGVRGVDVSHDGGRTWRPARLVEPDRPGAWRTWEADVDARPGTLSLMARATDRSGRVQPIAAPRDAAGYGNNSIHEVRLDVA